MSLNYVTVSPFHVYSILLFAFIQAFDSVACVYTANMVHDAGCNGNYLSLPEYLYIHQYLYDSLISSKLQINKYSAVLTNS